MRGDAEADVRGSEAEVLGYLAESTEHRAAIVSAGAIAPLVTLLEDEH